MGKENFKIKEIIIMRTKKSNELRDYRIELATYQTAIFDKAFMATWWASHSEDEPMESAPIAAAYQAYLGEKQMT